MIARLSAMLAAGLLVAGVASADVAGDDVSVLGSWAFIAKTFDACEFTGVARFSAGPSPTLHACELTARQACPDMTYTVRQSCTARRSGDQLIVRSEIEEFLEGEPTPTYWPDNFILTIKSDNRMIGALLSHGSHASEFTRTAEGIS